MMFNIRTMEWDLDILDMLEIPECMLLPGDARRRQAPQPAASPPTRSVRTRSR